MHSPCKPLTPSIFTLEKNKISTSACRAIRTGCHEFYYFSSVNQKSAAYFHNTEDKLPKKGRPMKDA